MAAYQFSAVIEDGVIRVPDEYADRLTSTVRVVIMPENKKVEDKAALFPHLHQRKTQRRPFSEHTLFDILDM